MKIKFLIFLLTHSLNAEAKLGYADSFSLSLGMLSSSVKENESQITGDADEMGTSEEPTSASVSAISLNSTYDFFATQKRNFFVQGSLPVISTGGTGTYLLGGGVNWYLSELATKYSYESRGSVIEINPEIAYYWGLNSGLGYLVYTTESSKKSDIFFDLGVHGGGTYSLSSKRALKAEAGITKTTGVATSGIKFNVFIGMVQYL